MTTSASPRTAGASLLFNPFDPRVNIDPYPHYARLRNEDPVHWSRLGVWFIGRYSDVRAVLKDRRFRVRDVSGLLRSKDKLVESEQISADQPRNIGHLVENSASWLAFKEGQDHKRLRGIYSVPLHRNAVELLRPFIREAAQSLVGAQLNRGEMDVMHDFVRHMPINTIARMVGLPREQLPVVQRWARELTRFIVSYTSLEDLGTLDRASAEFTAFLRELIEERRREPADDLISRLAAEHAAQGSVLTEQELVSVCVFIVVAGLEAVENLMGNGTLALLRNPDQLRLLQEKPEILPSAIEELMRFDTPLQMVMRLALEDVEVGGRTIRAGDQAYLVLGSANRDPERFDEPDALRLERPQNHHLSFGDGHHLCVGAQLARVQGQEALRVFLEMVSEPRLATDRLDWGRHLLSRGLLRLPVKFTPRS